MSARSSVLARGTLPASTVEQVVFTVPGGKTALVKSVLLDNSSVSAQGVNIRAPAPAGRVIYRNIPVPSAGSTALETWFVMHEGESLALGNTVVAATTSYYISGALLDA